MRRSLACTLLVGTNLAAQAEPPPLDLAALLPAETALLIECDDLRALLDTVLQFADPLPPAAQAAVAAGTLAAWAHFGQTLHAVLAAVAPREAAFALVVTGDGPPVPGFVARCDDLDAAQRVFAKLPGAGAVVDAARSVFALWPTPAHAARWQSFLASDHARLAQVPHFQRAQLPRPGLRLWLDIARVRGGRRLLGELDPGGTVLLGPLAAALDGARTLQLELAVTEGDLHVRGAVDASALAATPAAHLLAASDRPRPALRVPPHALAVLALDRSLRGYLEHLDDLLPADVATRTRAEAANLDLIIGGGSFPRDVLGGIAEPMHVVVVGAPRATAEPDDAAPNSDRAPHPHIDLPGIALVAELRTPRAQELLTKGFYRFSAIYTAQRAMQQLPPRVASLVRDGELRLHVMRGPRFPGVGEPPTSEQLEVTLVFAHGCAVLASTVECARAVVAALGGKRAAPDQPLHGDLLQLDGRELADYLQRNAGPLALGRVLDEGETLAQARQFVATLGEVLRGLTAQARVIPEAARTRVELHLQRSRR